MKTDKAELREGIMCGSLRTREVVTSNCQRDVANFSSPPTQFESSVDDPAFAR